VDDHHYTGIVKQNGKLTLTNTATLSADGKTLTVVDTMAGTNLKVIETWVKK
jgi:sugar lactone lactonase YvrE